MDGADSKRLWAEAQANVEKLNCCPRHLFEMTDEQVNAGPAALFGKKLTCQRCKGRMDMINVNQYVRGFAAAGGNPNDVLPGWNNDDTTETRRRFFRGED